MIPLHVDNPVVPGLYVAYVNDQDFPKGPAAKRILLMWDGRWGYPLSDQRFRGEVYQSVGPLPVLQLID